MIRDDLEVALRAKLQSAAPIDAVIRFDLGTDGTMVLNGRAAPPSVAETGPDPDTTITVSSADLQDMLAGRLDAMEAYTTGRLDVAGDMGPAMRLGSLLG